MAVGRVWAASRESRSTVGSTVAYTQKWLYVQHTRSTAGRVRAVSRALGLAGAGWAVDSMDRFPVPACFWSHCHSPNGAQTCTKPVCDCASRCK
eukprot:1149079-Pelagomonas_calceolata.AAC.2